MIENKDTFTVQDHRVRKPCLNNCFHKSANISKVLGVYQKGRVFLSTIYDLLHYFDGKSTCNTY